MWSASKLVLIIPKIGRGAGGATVVARNVDPCHQEHP
jgi:hypothetical protein